MFTGIVQEVGKVVAARPGNGRLLLRVSAREIVSDLQPGGSVAVDGACLTVTDTRSDWFEAEAVGETLARTTLGSLQPGSEVNLELPLRLSDRLGGHLVLGHVDGIATVRSTGRKGGDLLFTFGIPEQLSRYIVEKGSVAIDGISLTVAAARGSLCTVTVIPYTAEHTTLGRKRTGDRVNLEIDTLARYVASMLEQTRKVSTPSTRAALR